jgi:hypothetical protein
LGCGLSHAFSGPGADAGKESAYRETMIVRRQRRPIRDEDR